MTVSSLSASVLQSIRSKNFSLAQVLVGSYILLALAALILTPGHAHDWMSAPDHTLTLVLRAPAGSEQAVGEFVRADAIKHFYFPYAVGLVYLLCSLWTLWVSRQTAIGRSFAVLLASMALVAGLTFDRFSSHAQVWAWSLALSLAGGSLFSLGRMYSPADPLQKDLHRLHQVGYGLAALFFLPVLAVLSGLLPPGVYPWVTGAQYGFTGLAALYATMRVLRWLAVASPIEADRARLILYAALVSFMPLAAWKLAAILFPATRYNPAVLLPMIVFPVIAGFVSRREYLFRVNYVVSRVVLYGLLMALVMVGYALLVSGLSLLLAGMVSSAGPFLLGLILFILALVFTPVRLALTQYLDQVFLRGEQADQQQLHTFTGELTNLIELPVILKTMRRHIERSLYPDRLDIYLYAPSLDVYCAAPDEGGQPTSDITFSPGGPLVKLLQDDHSSLFVSRLDHLPGPLATDAARMQLVGAKLYVPLPGQNRLAGWLALGPRLSGQAYTAQELNYLENFSAQAALALERAQVAARMENRAREMIVLSRLAQGINVTLSFDDILELIYAQSAQIIPMQDFQLLLLEKETGSLSPVFYIEQDERYPQYENRPRRSGVSLEQEVIRNRRAIQTDDYAAECRRRGVVSGANGLTAWMGVPLNAGAETIGVLVAASREPGCAYTTDQLNLLQSVADQAAGAIVKTRLLQEAERRAMQLATLNDVTRKLASTLELEPLLETILNSAVDILNCEAGSLMMVDEQTGELVFRVAIGQVAAALVGRRLPVGSGLAGKAIRNCEVVLVNNVNEEPDWSSQTDRQTGFITRAVLVTPLVIKEKAIGVVEVINRRDGLPFGRDDVALLSAFASQAAVAVENARLYTMTDQALAARVEELSVMQRIDRELNASLDPSRAMRITLEWAMRQSNAEAGLVGLLQENGLQVMTWEGYGDELAQYANQPLPYDRLHLDTIIETGQTQSKALAANEPGTILSGAQMQTALAIQREGKVTGILLLENRAAEDLREDQLAFLNRLCDHASIAIANAQLYAQVQAANLAKSEFVSFVSHELKNPMTSVKGFTELLASGVVGPVSETQASFLGTIRSNIDRMNTLVSDLNDLSKIEVGRLRLDFKPHTLPEVVDEVSRSTRRQIEEKEQTLLLYLTPDLPPAWADRTRLTQVVVNLVSNANKYTERGGEISLGAEACENQWDECGARRVLHIWVKDSGIGISEEDQKKIFQKFFRSDDPKTREATGTGLGLNITRSLVEMQGGRIWFESTFRQGTTFHFTVPIAEQE